MEITPKKPGETTESPLLKIRGDEGLFLFACQVLVKYTNALEKEIEGVYHAEDIEFIHRMRVASRRVRTSLAVFKNCLPPKKGETWLAQIRKLTRALGQARDADVQIDLLNNFFEKLPNAKYKPGIRRLITRLDQQRTKMQKKVEAELDDLIRSKAIDNLKSKFIPYLEHSLQASKASPALFELAYSNINERLNEFLSYEVYLRQAEYKDELHAMRIAAKRLRYTMEIFSPLYNDRLRRPMRAIRKTQEMLGEIHDCDVWIQFLPEFEVEELKRIKKFYGNSRALSRLKPGLEFFLKNRQEERDRIYKHFLTEWSKWRKTETWLNLRETALMSVPKASVTMSGLPNDDNEKVQSE